MTPSSQDERSAFEAAILPIIERELPAILVWKFKRDSDGEYTSSHIQLAWDIWQAARASRSTAPRTLAEKAGEILGHAMNYLNDQSPKNREAVDLLNSLWGQGLKEYVQAKRIAAALREENDSYGGLYRCDWNCSNRAQHIEQEDRTVADIIERTYAEVRSTVPRCSAEESLGYQCVLLDGHKGRHVADPNNPSSEIRSTGEGQ